MPKEQLIDKSNPSLHGISSSSPTSSGRLRSSLCVSAGFTLIELIVVTGIIGILASIGGPVYKNFLDKAKSARAKQEVRLLETEINDHLVQTGSLPANLTVIGRNTLNDPWGHGYVYSIVPTRIRFTSLLNTDFDLCSKGEDGQTEAEVAGGGETGKDDLLRGGDGSFVGYGQDW